MPSWTFFSNSSSKSRPTPSRTSHDALDQPSRYIDRSQLLEYDAPVPTLHQLQSPLPPFTSTPPSLPHSRSLSNTVFGSGKKKTAARDEASSRSNQASSEVQLDGPSSPRKQVGKGRAEEADLERGACATCASKMQWPKSLSEYRCVTCLMVNDLKPAEKKVPTRKDSERLTSARTHTSSTSHAQATISLEYTRVIIDRCVDSYLHARTYQVAARIPPGANSTPKQQSVALCGKTNGTSHLDGSKERQSTASAMSTTYSRPNAVKANFQFKLNSGFETSVVELPPTSTAESSMTPSSTTAQNPQHAPARPSRSPPPPPVANNLAMPPSITRKPIPQPSQIAADLSDLETAGDPDQNADGAFRSQLMKKIFKPLEDYIAHTYANHECLNHSFLLARPRLNTPARSESSLRGRGGQSTADKPFIADSPLSELDAKTLLLGDVAENGLWWTGKDTRANSVGRRAGHGRSGDDHSELVHSRSPLINWPEVQSWYRAVVGAGIDWRNNLKEQDSSANSKTIYAGTILYEAEDIDVAFAEARVHLQKTLLKATEMLLKRPGRPLRYPSDIRFLLIIIANPLLYPASSLASVLSLERELWERPQERPLNKTAYGIASGFWEQGHAFGIIKRVLGLLSNLSNECHRFLTAWFARYDEVFFRQLLTLIQGFVTHRLGRRHKQKPSTGQLNLSDFVPNVNEPVTGTGNAAQLHATFEFIDTGLKPKTSGESKGGPPPYSDDWQLKAGARIMALLFTANKTFQGRRLSGGATEDSDPTAISRNNMKHHGQLLSTSEFYNLKADYLDIAADFASWESSQNNFSLCQYPFLLSVGMKIRIMELDVQRQMDVSAREAFFDTIFRNKTAEQHLLLKVRRECLIEDSLTAVDEAVAQGRRETKKALRVQFVDEPGIDAGGLRKEWFLLLVREIFDPLHGMFIYDEDSHLCYFNPHSFETSNQYFLVGALLGFAIYNLATLDVALPPFVFKKLLASSTLSTGSTFAFTRGGLVHYTLDDLSEYRPALAKGLRQLLEYEGDVQETYCRDFVVEIDRYGSSEKVILCPNGASTPVTNSNRHEFVDLYTRYLLDTQVSRQFEPFKRGFLQVCGGNALSLFQPEEIELLIRGSAEPLDVAMLKAVAVYDNWRRGEQKVENPIEEINLIQWFWEFFEHADPKDQRKLLSFITGSDRIPATGAATLTIKIGFAGKDYTRFPIARTCFNSLLLYEYRSKEELVEKLWRAVCESEGFGLK